MQPVIKSYSSLSRKIKTFHKKLEKVKQKTQKSSNWTNHTKRCPKRFLSWITWSQNWYNYKYKLRWGREQYHYVKTRTGVSQQPLPNGEEALWPVINQKKFLEFVPNLQFKMESLNSLKFVQQKEIPCASWTWKMPIPCFIASKLSDIILVCMGKGTIRVLMLLKWSCSRAKKICQNNESTSSYLKKIDNSKDYLPWRYADNRSKQGRDCNSTR